MNKTVSNILIILFSAIIAFSGFRLYKILHEYHEGEKQYEETTKKFTEKAEPAPEQVSDSTVEETVVEACPVSVDFDGLLAENPDVVGWIYSEDTPINYPVMRGKDNDTYLHHMINGEYNSSGSIFMDYRNDPALTGYNTIIYGHNMKNGSMFASLHKYIDQDFYDAHKYLWYLTPDHIYRLEAVAGYIGDAEAEIYTLFSNKDELDSYLSFAGKHSTFTADLPEGEISRIVALSTCSYEYSDARYVLVCVPVLFK